MNTNTSEDSPRTALEARLFELEQTLQAFDDLAYSITADGKGHPAWLFTITNQVHAVRQAHEALYPGALAVDELDSTEAR